jgi:WD40 repeat protein
VAITDDAQKIISTGQDKKIRIWDARSGHCDRILAEETAVMAPLSTSWDGQWVLMGGGDNTLRLWEIASGKRLKIFTEHKDRVTAAALTADKRWVVSASADQSIRFWDVSDGQSHLTVERQTGLITSLALSGDARWVFTSTTDGKLMLREVEWDYDFPEERDWDNAAEGLLAIFLEAHISIEERGGVRQRSVTWTEADFEALIEQLRFRGFGWLRPSGVREQLAKMAERQRVPTP